MDSTINENLLAMMGSMMQVLQAATPEGAVESNRVGSKNKGCEESQNKVEVELHGDSEGEVSEKEKTARAIFSDSSDTEHDTPPPKRRHVFIASD